MIIAAYHNQRSLTWRWCLSVSDRPEGWWHPTRIIRASVLPIPSPGYGSTSLLIGPICFNLQWQPNIFLGEVKHTVLSRGSSWAGSSACLIRQDAAPALLEQVHSGKSWKARTAVETGMGRAKPRPEIFLGSSFRIGADGQSSIWVGEHQPKRMTCTT